MQHDNLTEETTFSSSSWLECCRENCVVFKPVSRLTLPWACEPSFPHPGLLTVMNGSSLCWKDIPSTLCTNGRDDTLTSYHPCRLHLQLILQLRLSPSRTHLRSAEVPVKLGWKHCGWITVSYVSWCRLRHSPILCLVPPQLCAPSSLHSESATS
jgi:hypothetical protein